MARAKNPRRYALGKLRGMQKPIRELIKAWDQSQKINDENGWRPRLEHEKRENDPEAWRVLWAQAGCLETRARWLREFAAQQYGIANQAQLAAHHESTDQEKAA